MSQTVFERSGGFVRVRRIVTDFYDRMLDNPLLAQYFEHTDMRRLIDHQTKFISSVMGGPAAYTDEQLERSHAHLNIARSEFLEMASLLRETLEEHGLEPADVEEVHGAILARERFIVTRHNE
jgi:hemoglobin